MVLKGVVAAGAALALGLALRPQRKLSFRGRSVVITGGSRGLGLLLARIFAEEGASLTLLARDGAELGRVAREFESRGVPVLPLVCDVRSKEEVEGAVSRVMAHYGRLDVLVNNAGVIGVGPAVQMAEEDFEEALAVHFWGPLYAMRAVLPHMQRQGGGRIVNIASIGGKVAVPHLVPYSSSKFALVGLSDGMRAELSQDDILVTTVMPWLMRTGSHLHARFKGNRAAESTWFGLGASLPLVSVDARRAAQRIVEGCRAGKPRLMLAPQGRAAALAQEAFPELTASIMKGVARLLPPPDPRGKTFRKGSEVDAALVPSPLTRLADRAARRNNEVDMG